MVVSRQNRRIADRTLAWGIMRNARAQNPYKYSQSVRAGTRRRGGQQQNGLSTQKDTITSYRKKYNGGSSNRRYRRSAKRFRRMFQANLIKDLGTTSVLYNNNVVGSFTTGQSITAVHLYGNRGDAAASEIGMRDLLQSGDYNQNIDQTIEKCIYNNGFMDLTYHNTGTVSLEVDVYYLKYKKKAMIEQSISQVFAQAATDTPLVTPGVPFTSIELTKRGATPFQLPVALSKGISVIKKVKHLVTPGGYFTEQYKDTKKRWYSRADSIATNVNYKGWTTTALIITKKLIGTADATAANYSIGGTRTYTLKILQNNQDQDMAFP